MLSTTKNKAVVGLDVEAGSVAATEVASNGDSAVGEVRHGLRLAPGVFSEGEVADPEALGDALKELFSKHKLSKTVRLGLASQRVAVRTLALPLIEDHGELETAIRFQAQDHIPMPLEQAVLDWQVVGHATGENGERQIEVVAVAARRDMLGGLMQALSRAGLRPVGIDLSAFGMIRALAGGSSVPVEPGDYVDAPGYGPASYEQGIARQLGGEGSAAAVGAGEHAGEALLQPRRRHQPRGGPRLQLPVHPRLAVRGRGDRPEARRAAPAHPRARPPVARPRGPRQPGRGDRGRQRDVSAARDSLAEGAARLVDELRLSLEYYAAQEGAVPIEGIVACGPGTTIPGLDASASSATSASGSRSAGPRLSPTWTTRPRPG